MVTVSPTLRIDLEPIGRRIEIEAGQTLLDAAQAAGIEMVAVCGGAGWCATCLVRPLAGQFSEPTETERDGLSAEQLAAGYRLACQARPLSHAKVEIPPDSLASSQRLQLEGQETQQVLEPLIHAVDVSVAPPSLDDQRADATRLQDAVEAVQGYRPNIPYVVLRELSGRLRQQNWSARLALRRSSECLGEKNIQWIPDEVVSVLPTGTPLLGLAVDVGTTKIAAYLVDLATGRTLVNAGAVNPQIAYGEDVLTRIGYANRHAEARSVLQARIAGAINGLADELCTLAGASAAQVSDAVLVGNTAMHHLLAALPVHQLGVAPFVCAVGDPLDVRASELGLRLAPGAYAHLPPNIAGFVGSDHVAMALATGAWETSRTIVAVDIGTNTEIALAQGGRIWACSCASGPAFEGAHIHDGMRAAPGAIERVQIRDGKAHVKTIGDQRPTGICGSGILDAIGELRRAGIMDHKGFLDEHAPGVSRTGALPGYTLLPAAETGHGRPILITRKDIYEIQLAKAAIRTGVEILLHEARAGYEEIEEFIIAGAFGTYLDIESAIATRMFPPIPAEHFRQVGNAAGAGARQMLVSAQRRSFAAERARQVTYVELTAHPEFKRTYMEAMAF